MVLSSASRAGGGIFQASRGLAVELGSQSNIHVSIVGIRDRFSDADAEHWSPVDVKVSPPTGPRLLGWSSQQARLVTANTPDIIHQHGIWELQSATIYRLCRTQQIPYVVSVHGMLHPWARRHSQLKKYVAWQVYQKRHLAQASCICVKSLAEAADVRALGLHAPVALLPNAVKRVAITRQPAAWVEQLPAERKVVLFLGRLHPKKGLVNLLNAWGRLHASKAAQEWSLVIAGSDDDGYEQQLKRIALEQNLKAPRLLFVGPLFERQRDAAMQNADAFILPSVSEGMPMAVLEAMSSGTPVLMTPHCNLQQAFDGQAALRIESDANSIRDGLDSFMALSLAERELMGRRGQRLADAEFTWPRVAEGARRLYLWLLGQGERPGDILVSH